MSTTAGKFEDRLDGAAFWEAWVASRITRTIKGASVTLMSVGEAKDVTVYPDMRMNIDGLDGRNLDLEVKSRNVSFTGVSDYPFPTINTCSKSYWERTGHLGRQYLIVSQSTGNIIWIPSWVEKHQKVAMDNTRGQQFDCMAVDTMEAKDWHDFVSFCHGQKVT